MNAERQRNRLNSAAVAVLGLVTLGAVLCAGEVVDMDPSKEFRIVVWTIELLFSIGVSFIVGVSFVEIGVENRRVRISHAETACIMCVGWLSASVNLLAYAIFWYTPH